MSRLSSRSKPSTSVIVYRLISTLLLCAIVVVLVQLADALLSFREQQSVIAAFSESAPATATALAASDPTGEGPSNKRSRSKPAAQEFPTNTPSAPSADVTAAPTPIPTQVDPRPLPTLFAYGEVGVAASAPTAVPTPVEAVNRHGDDLLNIILLGNDNEITGESLARTDTMIIVSINRTAGTVALLSLPRDLYVYIPGWTMQRLNLAYPYGEAIGWTNGGFGLLRQTIFYNLGINVHYYAMVDLSGFKALVDAVGGVNISVDCGIQDLPLLEAEVPADAYPVGDEGEFVLPVGHYHLDGAEALWYARSRSSSTDFDRGIRQQQVLRAVWRQARENGLLAQAPTLYTEFAPYVQTDLALEDILSLIPLAASLDPGRIEQFSLVRTYHTTPWQTPDGDYVQLPVYETLRPLLEDFYTAPTQNQAQAEAATVGVYNGTDNAGLDIVAAERLQQEGFNAVPLGSSAETGLADTTIIDYTGRSKGSSLDDIGRLLNINPENVTIEPNAGRDYDFVVTLGSTYNSCTRGGVLPVDAPETGA
jgi:LCP family protein required for cell wall assembly